MSAVGTRRILHINNDRVETESGSLDYDLGGREGSPMMSSVGWSGNQYETKPGTVTAKVVLNSNLKPSWWNPNASVSVIVEHPETGVAAVFDEMRITSTFAVSGGTATLELAGTAGTLQGGL